ncbi:MAG: hypothetical protein Q9207_002742 [Kuettlingeria erythrocarpa]
MEVAASLVTLIKTPYFLGLRSPASSANAITAVGQRLFLGRTSQGDGASVRLRKALALLESELKPRDGYAAFGERLIWTHKKKKTKDLVTQLDQLKGVVDTVLNHDHFQVSIDTNRITSNIIHSIEQLRTEPVQRETIKWLSPLQFPRRQSDILNGKMPMGEGLLASDVFNAWTDGAPWTLVGYGRPGSGKTVLSSMIVNRLRKRLKPDGVPVLCMFLDHKERDQTLPNLIGSLLQQLIQFQGGYFKSPQVHELFREAAFEASPLLDVLYEALRAQIMTFPRVMLVVDALYGLPAALHIELLVRLRRLSQTKLNIMKTSRPPKDMYIPKGFTCNNCGQSLSELFHNCDICDDGKFDLCQGCVNQKIHCQVPSHQLAPPMDQVLVNIEPTDEDVRRYVEHELDKELELGPVATRVRRLGQPAGDMTRLARFCRQMPELRLMIPQYIQASCKGMFMLANLYITAINAKTSADEVKNALENPPQGYDDLYKMTED